MLLKPWETEQQWEEILIESEKHPVGVFKHSTRCSISHVAHRRLSEVDIKDLEIYYLDLLRFRNLSGMIAQKLNVEHESPQLVIISNHQVKRVLNHFDIAEKNLKE